MSPPGRRRWRGSTPSSRWPASHASSSAWRPTRSSPTCARYPPCGPTQDPKDARRLAAALFTKLEVEGYTKMRYAAHAGRCYPRSRRSPTGAARRPVVTQVGLVGARGFEPPTSASRTLRAAKLRHAPTEGTATTQRGRAASDYRPACASLLKAASVAPSAAAGRSLDETITGVPRRLHSVLARPPSVHEPA